MPAPSDAPHLPRSAPIEAYGNGGFAFADMSHRGSLLCLPDAIWTWPVVRPDEINEVWIPPSWLRDRLRKVGVVIDAMQTGPAIRTYNIMIGERRRVAAALMAVP